MALRWLVLLLVPVLVAGCSHSRFIDRTGGPGDAARDLVSSRDYDNLVIEIDHPPGYAPDAAALNDFKTVLSGVIGKRSITWTLDPSIPAEPGKRYTYAEIEALERAHRGRHSGGEDAVLYVIYLAGGSEVDTDQTKALGAVYRPTSVVMFKGNIQASSKDGFLDLRPEIRFVERAVLVHEFGHAAGLVNLGTPMVRPHEDSSHPGHSKNVESVMYWALDTSAGLETLLSRGASIPYQFDEDDKADLRALRDS